MFLTELFKNKKKTFLRRSIYTLECNSTALNSVVYGNSSKILGSIYTQRKTVHIAAVLHAHRWPRYYIQFYSSISDVLIRL